VDLPADAAGGRPRITGEVRELIRASTSDRMTMRFGRFAFGSIEVDGLTYEHDLIVDGERVRKRRKAPSKPFRPRFGHTPAVGGRGHPVGLPLPDHRHRG
jgi:hypothetical protein